MSKNQKKFVKTYIILFVLVVVVILAYVNIKPKAVAVPEEEAVACTMDAKMCPDGSYVGRVAPNCEFAKCPVVAVAPYGATATLNQKIFLGGGVYVTPLKVLADSRCPVDVTCIQAGYVTLKVKLEKDGTSKEMEIKGGSEGVNFGPMVISLVGVSPEANSKKTISTKDYKFNFETRFLLD